MSDCGFVAGEDIKPGAPVYIGADGKARMTDEYKARLDRYEKLWKIYLDAMIPEDIDMAESLLGRSPEPAQEHGSWRDRPPLL